MGNHVSANECDYGTNYLRQPRYHCILLIDVIQTLMYFDGVSSVSMTQERNNLGNGEFRSPTDQ